MTLAKRNHKLNSGLDVDYDADGNVIGLAINVSYDVDEDGVVVASPSKSVAVWDRLTSTQRTAANSFFKRLRALAEDA